MSTYREASPVDLAEQLAQLRRELDTERARSELLEQQLRGARESAVRPLARLYRGLSGEVEQLEQQLTERERQLAKCEGLLAQSEEGRQALFIQCRLWESWHPERHEAERDRRRILDLERQNDELRAIVRHRTAQRIDGIETALAQARRRAWLFGLLAFLTAAVLVAALLRCAGVV